TLLTLSVYFCSTFATLRRKFSQLAFCAKYFPNTRYICGSKRCKLPVLSLKISLNLHTRPTRFLNESWLRLDLPRLLSRINILSAGRFTPDSNVELVMTYLTASSF